MNALGWIGDGLLVGGVWFLSEKKRWAFLVQATGSLVWGINGYLTGMWNLVALNIVFIAIGIRGYYTWKSSPPMETICKLCSSDHKPEKAHPEAENCKYELRAIKTGGEGVRHAMMCYGHNVELKLVRSNPFNDRGNDWGCPITKKVLGHTGWQ